MQARVVALASGRGSNLAALLRANDPSYRVVGVVSDKERCGALEHARSANIEAVTVPFSRTDREGWNSELARSVQRQKPDIVVFAGFMRVVSEAFLRKLPKVPILNLHPSLLPAFPGAHAIDDAWEAGVPVTGCTVHRVTPAVDAGPILAQSLVPRRRSDTRESLEARLHAAEHALLPYVVQCLSQLPAAERSAQPADAIPNRLWLETQPLTGAS